MSDDKCKTCDRLEGIIDERLRKAGLAVGFFRTDIISKLMVAEQLSCSARFMLKRAKKLRKEAVTLIDRDAGGGE